MSRLAVPKTYKLYIGGEFPRSESGRTYEVAHAEGRVPRERRAGQPQGRSGCRGRRPRRRVRLVGRHGLQPRPGAVPHRRAARGPSRPVRRRDLAQPRASRPPPRPPRSTRPSTPGSGTPGWADKYVAGRRQRQPGRRARTSTSRCPSRPGSSRSSRRRVRAGRCSGSCSVVAPALVAGNTVVVVADRAAPAQRDQPGRGARDERRARGSGQHPDRVARRDRAVARLARRRQRARPRGRRGARVGRPRDRRRRHAQARARARSRAFRRAASIASWRFIETKTVWHTKALI